VIRIVKSNANYRSLIAVLATGILLAGCAGPTERIAPASEREQPAHQRLPELLYISETKNVLAFNYARGYIGKLALTIPGFEDPNGLCSGSDSGLWVTDRVSRKIYKYAYGSTLILETIHEVGKEQPTACAVDDKNGNLAVANISGRSGAVRIFKVIDHRGTAFKLGQLDAPTAVGYDNQGNLFATSTNNGLYELTVGGASFSKLSVSGGTFNEPVGVQEVDPDLLITGLSSNGATGFKVSVSGKSAKIVATIALEGTEQLTSVGGGGRYLIVPDSGSNTVRIYTTATGSEVSSLSSGLDAPFGAAVDQAPQK
jgi:WD40 repeat protein